MRIGRDRHRSSGDRRGSARAVAAALILVGGLAGSTSSAHALTGSSSGTFTNPVENGAPNNAILCGGSGQAPCTAYGIRDPAPQVRWGGASSPSEQSGLAYQGGPSAVSVGTPFVLGSLTHINHVVSAAGATVTSVNLDVAINVQLTTPSGQTISGTIPVPIGVDETNNAFPCAYPSPGGPCADAVFVRPPIDTTLQGGDADTVYTLHILGVSTDPGGQDIQTAFYAQEDTTVAVGYIVGQVTVEHRPIANAGPSQRLDQDSASGAAVQLDGRASSDADGDPLTYTWTGPFGTATGPTPNVTLPPGTSTVTLTVSDGRLSSEDTTTVTVYPPIAGAGRTVATTEGTPFSAPVARFTDPDPQATADEYAATIDWGDGTPATIGAVTQPGGPGTPFTVVGDHVYAEELGYTPTVTITDTDTPFNRTTIEAAATAGDAALSASGVAPTSPQGFNGAVATFTDANGGATTADFSASIDWGDGHGSTGVVTGGGGFAVGGTHTYTGTGFFTVTVKIVDDGGSTATATSRLLIFGLAPAGSFVIGDRNAAVGTSATFWGAQWSKLNTLSGGSAPASFKGFEDDPAVAACGTRWTTDPGNSTPPPAGALPSYMAVIVASAVTKTGPTIAGDTVHEVVVKTDPGYGPNPGHAGSGTVIAQIC
jgi:hypothetical protein